ncbi:hypothetical protein CVD25_10110 [Bacillus canaveralius]|uniref:Uncharacterized protein n=1 Tax=Bacillus canaveralius TaxID=1403243 RepID=A0A2N5GMC0_9BACI|nr:MULTISPECIES: hypothetical protein [Bacillus]PLR83009.1 hypothetical protein CU635_11090 [Bacillus canaveralius]PLR87931.1 hypothetical protein CVD23_00305 [Bacillus sp. V33-4]PLR96987.1 hypothetical protein CVD25_10110 [Bacillus canaveralius]RSK47918.1 hypothetical protein EJA13_17745 [Bacillus canaveralius]
MDENELTQLFPEPNDLRGYQAHCAEHSPRWEGQCKSNNYDAFEDAKAHDEGAHGGKRTATVSRSSCTP